MNTLTCLHCQGFILGITIFRPIHMQLLKQPRAYLCKRCVDVCEGAIRLWDVAVSHELPKLSTGEGCTVLGLPPAPGHALLPAAVGIIHHSQLRVHTQQLVAQRGQNLHTENSMVQAAKAAAQETYVLYPL